MSIATAEICGTGIALRLRRRTSPVVVFAGALLTAAALVPFAIAAFGIARGGIEPYMVLAALMLG